jgi:hypothetical protein
MPKFGQRSESNLRLVHPVMVTIVRSVIVFHDFTVLDGWRDHDTQHRLFLAGASKLDWPNSTHCHMRSDELGRLVPCSLAIDLAPWYTSEPHIRWNAVNDFALLAGRIIQTADLLGYSVRWGGDWNRNNSTTDNTFNDYGHFELARDYEEAPNAT